jgi:hypothetical protein
MPLYNAWVSIRDDFAFPADDPVDDTELQAKNRETLARCGDIEVIPNIFKTRTQGPRDWQVYSLLYDLPEERDLEQALERFKSENAGQADVLSAWIDSEGGAYVGTVNIYSIRIVTKTWSILNPDYQPDPEEPDFDDRYVLRITGDVEEEYVSGYTGTPLYPPPGNLSSYMPDDGDGPNPTLRDVNLYAGQTSRVFL